LKRKQRKMPWQKKWKKLLRKIGKILCSNEKALSLGIEMEKAIEKARL
jgi:hypothetical protein